MRNCFDKSIAADGLFIPMPKREIEPLVNAFLGVAEPPANIPKTSIKQDDPYLQECMQSIHNASASVMPLIDDLFTNGTFNADHPPASALAVPDAHQDPEQT